MSDSVTKTPVNSFYRPPYYTTRAIKTLHFIFHYNSGISGWIFTLYVPVETGMKLATSR